MPLSAIPEVNEDYSRSSSFYDDQPSSSYRSAKTSFSGNSEYFDAQEEFKDFEEGMPEFPIDEVNKEISKMYDKLIDNISKSFKEIDKVSSKDDKKSKRSKKREKKKKSRSKGKGKGKGKKGGAMMAPKMREDDISAEDIHVSMFPEIPETIHEKITTKTKDEEIEGIKEQLKTQQVILEKLSQTQDQHGEMLETVKNTCTKVLSGTTKILTDTTDIKQQNEKIRQNIENMHEEMRESFGKILDEDDYDNCLPMRFIKKIYKNKPYILNNIFYLIVTGSNIGLFLAGANIMGGSNSGTPSVTKRFNKLKEELNYQTDESIKKMEEEYEKEDKKKKNARKKWRKGISLAKKKVREDKKDKKIRDKKKKKSKGCIRKTIYFLGEIFCRLFWRLHVYFHSKIVLIINFFIDFLIGTLGKIPFIGSFVIAACKLLYYLSRLTLFLGHIVIIGVMMHAPAMIIQYFYGTQYKWPEYVFTKGVLDRIIALLSPMGDYLSSLDNIISKNLKDIFGPASKHPALQGLNYIIHKTIGGVFPVEGGIFSFWHLWRGMKEIFLSIIVWVFGDFIPGLTGRMAKHGNLVSPDALSKFTADDGGFIDAFGKTKLGYWSGTPELSKQLKTFRDFASNMDHSDISISADLYDVDTNLSVLPIWQRATLDSALNPSSQEPSTLDTPLTIPLDTPLTIDTPMTNLTHSTTPGIVDPSLRTPDIIEVLKDVKKDEISELSGDLLREEAYKYNVNARTGQGLLDVFSYRDDEELKKELFSKVDDGTIPIGGSKRNKRSNKRTNKKRTNKKRTNKKRTNKKRSNRKRYNRKRYNKKRR